MRQAQVEVGICAQCDQPIAGYPVSRTYCEPHARRNREYKRLRRQRLILERAAVGICLECERRITPAHSTRLCDKHLKRKRRVNQESQFWRKLERKRAAA